MYQTNHFNILVISNKNFQWICLNNQFLAFCCSFFCDHPPALCGLTSLQVVAEEDVEMGARKPRLMEEKQRDSDRIYRDALGISLRRIWDIWIYIYIYIIYIYIYIYDKWIYIYMMYEWCMNVYFIVLHTISHGCGIIWWPIEFDHSKVALISLESVEMALKAVVFKLSKLLYKGRTVREPEVKYKWMILFGKIIVSAL